MHEQAVARGSDVARLAFLIRPAKLVRIMSLGQE